jgi:hypothetical protein
VILQRASCILSGALMPMRIVLFEPEVVEKNRVHNAGFKDPSSISRLHGRQPEAPSHVVISRSSEARVQLPSRLKSSLIQFPGDADINLNSKVTANRVCTIPTTVNAKAMIKTGKTTGRWLRNFSPWCSTFGTPYPLTHSCRS